MRKTKTGRRISGQVNTIFRTQPEEKAIFGVAGSSIDPSRPSGAVTAVGRNNWKSSQLAEFDAQLLCGTK
jgi:hypothetical protein